MHKQLTLQNPLSGLVNKTMLAAKSHDPQTTRDGALTRSKYRSDEQHLGMAPDTIRKQRSKHMEHRGKQRRHRKQIGPLPRSVSKLNQTTRLSDSFAFLPFTVLAPSMSSEALLQARSVQTRIASGSVLKS